MQEIDVLGTDARSLTFMIRYISLERNLIMHLNGCTDGLVDLLTMQEQRDLLKRMRVARRNLFLLYDSISSKRRIIHR